MSAALLGTGSRRRAPILQFLVLLPQVIELLLRQRPGIVNHHRLHPGAGDIGVGSVVQILPADRHLENGALPATGGIDVANVRGRRLGQDGGSEDEQIQEGRQGQGEIRNPKAEGRRKSEDRKPKRLPAPSSAEGAISVVWHPGFGLPNHRALRHLDDLFKATAREGFVRGGRGGPDRQALRMRQFGVGINP